MGKTPQKTKEVVHHRSAKDGKYVTEEYAKNHKATTVREVDKIKVKK